jgi:hypothetical protein
MIRGAGASVLLLLVGLLAGWAAIALFELERGESFGITASRHTIEWVAVLAALVAVGLIYAGVAAALRSRVAWPSGLVAMTAFVVAGFIGNYALFEEPRLLHTGTNVVVAAATVWLLWSARTGRVRTTRALRRQLADHQRVD